MNSFDLNRKEYIRVNNAGGDEVINFAKVTFLTSFVITGDNSRFLPTSYDPIAIKSSNDRLLTNIQDYCSYRFPQEEGYACYISEMGVLNSTTNVNIPYANVNVYAMDGLDITT